MVSDADPSDRLTPARDAIERDVRELRVRARAARAKVAAALTSIADVRQVLSAVIRRRDRNGESPP
jgi:hypothetical protein